MTSSHDDAPSVRYFFNPTTGEVEEGRQSSWQGRMGPYDTREEARAALEKASERNARWDEEDRRRQAEDDAWGAGEG